MATLAQVTGAVQTLCNDQDASVLTTTYLLGYINLAVRELAARLRAASIPRVEHAVVLTLPIGTTAVTTTSTPALPANFDLPDELWEKPSGAPDVQYVRMVGPARLPHVAQLPSLGYWEWSAGQLSFVGATTARDVQLYYYGELVPFADPNDNTDVLGSENALAYYTAALLMRARNLSTSGAFQQDAERAVEQIINQEVTARQSLPVRRQPRLGVGRYLQNSWVGW